MNVVHNNGPLIKRNVSDITLEEEEVRRHQGGARHRQAFKTPTSIYSLTEPRLDVSRFATTWLS